jgi:hypothetical protein
MATTPYTDVSGFSSLTLAPDSYVDDAEARYPGWLLGQLVHWSAWINSQLIKRYAVPFESPYPETVINWLIDIVTLRLYFKLGIDSTDAQFTEIIKASETAKTEVQNASDSPEGHWELPLRANDPASAVSKTGPLAYGEQSPYRWTTLQQEAAESEDQL